jgi:predicted enzyme related to lactoylglutathione lyase
MNQLGLTHLSVRVDDVDAVAAVVEARGGSVVSGTRTILGDGETSLDLVYCTDPDGVRIELMKLPGSPR